MPAPLLLLFISLWMSEEDTRLGHLPLQNPDLFEGDILGISPDEDRNAIVSKIERWPHGIIYYTIDESLETRAEYLEEIMKLFEENTCLKFVRRSQEHDFVHFYKGLDCSSYVGRVIGRQRLSLGDDCWYPGIVAHEISHAIGFLHEQNRSDRDDYITIHWENILEGAEGQFKKFPPSQHILYNEFEYESIMLYGEKTFSRDLKLKTVTAKKKGVVLKDITDKFYPTESDYYRINRMYSCVQKMNE